MICRTICLKNVWRFSFILDIDVMWLHCAPFCWYFFLPQPPPHRQNHCFWHAHCSCMIAFTLDHNNMMVISSLWGMWFGRSRTDWKASTVLVRPKEKCIRRKHQTNSTIYRSIKVSGLWWIGRIRDTMRHQQKTCEINTSKKTEHHEKSMKQGPKRLDKQFNNEVRPPECKQTNQSKTKSMSI